MSSLTTEKEIHLRLYISFFVSKITCNNRIIEDLFENKDERKANMINIGIIQMICFLLDEL
jgi:hypothetical protein